ncbi:transketolase [Peptoniphilus sp. KCTC 25270]|uniref:transketolase n=1 Tax=Peptoniphilus sp. KCTC 25270 TaxID=2897414 RepID=UPI001E3A6BDB|nr:transketolase [Peptoniphilus sp. KCTC 25270]MCD1146789.1 transketolase [Peptoniphilus sp. KCTC 25270]
MSREHLAVNTLRVLSIDQVDSANSGHPGLPLGASPMAWELWANHMNFNPKQPNWINRDRFILSAGHGSSLLYSLLHVFGYGVSKGDLKNFRQLNSLTPGHPEYGHTVGVETTTGPLGAGISTAVGFAMAESKLAEKYNKDDAKLIDHYTYVLVGDGDLMEGVSNEASSLAGTLELGKMIVLYDSNNITIEGDTDLAFRENVGARYEALDWHVLTVEDGTNLEEIGKAIEEAKKETKKPSLIEIKTKIGYGSPLEGSASVHGSPLGVEKSDETRKKLEYPTLEPFEIHKDVQDLVAEKIQEKDKEYEKWLALEESYKEKYPEVYKQFLEDIGEEEKDLSFLDSEEFWTPVEKDMATRESSHVVLQRVAKGMGNLFGGSADLAPSNKSDMKEMGQFSAKDRSGANINFGVREHAMGAIVNGIYLHGGFRSYGATFLIFSDYMKPQIRLSALMNLPVTFIFTHDSIGVGEDGPTHQPIEQLTMLRSIPNLITYRPADSTEVAAGWYVSMQSKSTPVALALSRQKLSELENTSKEAVRGGYIVGKECKESIDCILMASGSEVSIAMELKEEWEKEGKSIRVVSMPSMELFEAQSKAYREMVLPCDVRKRISMEAGSTLSWNRYIGLDGIAIGIDEFGACGPGSEVFDHFGLTVEKIKKHVKDYI